MSSDRKGSGDGPKYRWLPLRTVPDPIWGPLAVGSMMLGVGSIALAAGRPWLFPSLGPTAFLQGGKTRSPFRSIL